MHRKPLLALLAKFNSTDGLEARAHREIEEFVQSNSDCFTRSLQIGHITGSAWLVDRSGTRVLLTHHRKLGKWLQLGGHCDGNPDVLDVALREAREESGIADIVPVSRAIFDLDVHLIPARSGEPQHYHYDVRFLLRVETDDTFRVSPESSALAWVGKADLPKMPVDESVLRMYRKWTQRGNLNEECRIRN